MKPAPFDYFVPREPQEAFSLLERYGEEAKILAGGQSLMPLMNLRLARPGYLIDINRLTELSYVKESNGYIKIGALTRHRTIERSEVIRRKCPILARATSLIGHPAIRNRGTLGGSLCHADPVAELPLVVTALQGEIRIVSSRNERVGRPEEFFLGPLSTSLGSGEMVVEVQVPMLSPGTGWAFQELSRPGGFAIVAVAVLLTLNERKQCRTVSIAAAGAGPTPTGVKEAEQMLLNQTPNEKLIEEVSRTVADESSPGSDIAASSEYRLEMIRVFTKRALQDAVRTAGRI